MKLLIISDLHFDKTNDWVFIERITNEMTHSVSHKMVEKEEILLVVLGDIIHRGGEGNIDIKFSEAEEFFEKIRVKFDNIKFLFVPGNHEILNFDIAQFNEFSQKYSCRNDITFSMKQSVFSHEVFGFNLILVDSNLTRNHDLAGKIDIDLLKSRISKNKNIIFMHHPPCYQDGIDRNITNSSELMATHTNFIFYGHQHGGVKVPDFLNIDTDIHFVGTLLKQERGINNEFILIDIQDGKINYAYRYIHNGTHFFGNLLFPPKTELKSDHLTFGKPHKNETSIVRKLKKIANKADSEYPVWSRYISKDINTIVSKQNKLIIVGDAGTGKSFELSNIYWNFENNEEYFPIWVSLKSTNYPTVKRFIDYSQNNTIDRKNVMLIIDGLDEMNGDKIADLLKDIESAVNNNPEAKIILSIRTNFKVNIEGFFAYRIMPFEDEEIVKFALERGVAIASTFFECLSSSGCLPLARIPFYLNGIIQIYLINGTLPKPIELLDKMISLRFIKADERETCAYEKTFMANECKLRFSLKKLSFIMQSLHKYSLENNHYTRFISLSVRQLLIKLGLLICNDGLWEFEHNIFREYLTAEYLCDIPHDELLKIITFDNEQKQLRPSWVNVVPFLLSMRKDDCLKNWLIDKAKDIFCELETDQISIDERNDLFIAIMGDSFSKGLPIYSLYNDEKLARNFQSENTVNFMLEVLKKPMNSSAVLSVLHLLYYYRSFYEKEENLKDVILSYVNESSTEYLASYAIKTLSNCYKAKTSELVIELYQTIKTDNRLEIIGAFCDLLVCASLADEYSDYVFDKLENTDVSDNYHAWDGINNSIKSFKDPKNILHAINWLCNEESHSFFKEDELFKALFSKCLALFNEGSKIIFDELIYTFSSAAGKCNRQKSKVIKQFFVESGILSDAFEEILKIKIPSLEMVYTIEGIMDESLTSILINSYLHDEVDSDAYKCYAKRLPQDSLIFVKLNNAVIEKEGCEIHKEEKKDWNALLIEGTQKYFNSLFDKVLFTKLIEELLTFLDYDIKCGELLGASFSKVPYDRKDLNEILRALYHNGKSDWPVSQFIKLIDWDFFSIFEICKVLKHDEQVVISHRQEQEIKTYFDKTIVNNNFEAYDENIPEHRVLLWHAIHIVLLMGKFNFVCSDEKLLEMLMLPWHVFSSPTSTDESETLNFVLERISDPEKLKKRILENIKYKILPPHIAQTHILYCLKNNLPDAVDMAVDLFFSSDENALSYKYSATDYLISIRSEKFVDELIDKLNDNDLIRYLSYKMKNENKNLIAKMVYENQKSEDNTLFLSELIKVNNKYALEVYLKMAQKNNTLPDMQSEDSRVPEITNAIRDVSDARLVDTISKLMILSFSDGFKDKESFGLKGSLDNAIYNMIRDDKFAVKNMLIELIQKNPQNDKLISICNWHLNDIEKLINTASDVPWNISEIESFIKKHNNDIQ